MIVCCNMTIDPIWRTKRLIKCIKFALILLFPRSMLPYYIIIQRFEHKYDDNLKYAIGYHNNNTLLFFYNNKSYFIVL